MQLMSKVIKDITFYIINESRMKIYCKPFLIPQTTTFLSSCSQRTFAIQETNRTPTTMIENGNWEAPPQVLVKLNWDTNSKQGSMLGGDRSYHSRLEGLCLCNTKNEKNLIPRPSLGSNNGRLSSNTILQKYWIQEYYAR